MRTFVLLGVFSVVALPIWAADAAAKAPVPPPSVAPEEIIKKFAAKEAEFAEARSNYTYRQTVKTAGTRPRRSRPAASGNWWRTLSFHPTANAPRKVTYAPVVSLRNLILTPSDEQDLRDVQPFVLTTKEIPEYDIQYLGKQNADEIPCYNFAVKPKKMVQGKRYFEGQIWVDDRDFQIVKTYGKGVGVRHGDEQFPRFETYREQIDGKYWFPTYTRADDVLHFKDMNQRVKMTVKYENYKRFEGRSTIKFGDVVDDKGKPSGQPTAPPAAAPNPPKK